MVKSTIQVFIMFIFSPAILLGFLVATIIRMIKVGAVASDEVITKIMTD